MPDLAPLQILIVLDGSDYKSALALAKEAEMFRKEGQKINPLQKLPVWDYEIVRPNLDEAQRSIKNWDAIILLKASIPNQYHSDVFGLMGFDSLPAKNTIFLGIGNVVPPTTEGFEFDCMLSYTSEGGVDWRDAAETIYDFILGTPGDAVYEDEYIKKGSWGLPADIADIFDISKTKPSLSLQIILNEASENYARLTIGAYVAEVTTSSLFQAMFQYNLDDRSSNQISWGLKRLSSQTDRSTHTNTMTPGNSRGTTELRSVLELASASAILERGQGATVGPEDIILPLLDEPSKDLTETINQLTGFDPGTLTNRILSSLEHLPEIEVGIEMRTEADVYFCSVFAEALPGDAAEEIAEVAGWSKGVLDPVSVKKGFAFLSTENLDGGLPVKPVYAVASHGHRWPADEALPRNLKKAIDRLPARLEEQVLWFPLMGSSAGKLAPIDSLKIMVGAMREGGLFDKMQGGKITFSIRADQVDALPALQAYLKDIFPSYIDESDEHETVSAEQRALFKSELKNDQASNEDHLGHDPIVRALDEFLRADGTRPPLVIGIDAPWGAGKSSVMRMLRDRLQEDAEDNVEEGLAKAAEPLDWKDATKLTKEASKEQAKIDNESDKPPKKRSFETVYFNAWRHGDGERLTANLVNTVIESISAQKGEAFWLRLNLNRFDLQEIKLQFFLKFITKSVTTLIGLAFFAIVALLGFVQFGLDVWYGNLTFFGGSIVCLAFIGNAWRKFRKSPVDVSVEQYFRVPDYDKLRGAQSEIEDDFRRVLSALKQEDTAKGTETMLAIFIDDLDRCGPAATAKIVETINVFFGQETENCIFILGMHKHMVAASLELAYERLTKHAENDPALVEELPFGRRFLEKIVQFHVRIPEPDEQSVERYLAHLTGTSSASTLADRDLAILRAYAETADEDATIDDAPVEILQSLALPVAQQEQETDTSAPPPPPISEEERAANEARQAALKKQFDGEKRLQRAIKLDEKDPNILRVFNAVKFALRKNPRQYVRFLNALRFANFLDSFDHRERSGTAADQILDLAKREVLALEWPELHALLLSNNVDFEEFFSEVHVGAATPGRLSEYLSDVIGLDADDSFAAATIDKVLSDKLLIDLATVSID